MNIFELVGTIALQGAEAAEKQLKGLEALTKKNAKAFKAVGAVMTGFGLAVTGALAFATKSALDEEVGIKRLDVALRNAGASYGSLKDEIENAIAATERKTNYSDGEQRDALVALVGVTGTYTGALQQLQLATDLAATKNMDLNSAALLVGRAAMGNTQLLSRYGIVVKEGATSTEILTMMQERFAGAAAGAANPLTVMKNAVSNLSEDIGSILVPILKAAVAYIKPVIENIRAWTKEHPELTKAIVIFGGALSALMGLVLGPLLLILPKLVSGFVAVRNSIFAVRLATIEWTMIVLAAIVAVYGIINLIRALKSESKATEGTIFDAIKRDIGSLMSSLESMLPSSSAAIEEATSQGKANFDNMASGVSGTTQALDTFNQKANEVREAERRLALDFVDLWKQITYSDTAAGKLNLTMDDVYQALYKLGYGVKEIGTTFEKFQLRTDAVGQVLAEYGLTAEQVAKLVGKLTDEVNKQTDALNKQTDAAHKSAVAISGRTKEGYYMTPWGVIIGEGERALGPGELGKRPEYIGGQGLTGRFYAHGGVIEEPTLLTRLRDMKTMGIAGEAGPEPFGPARGVVITGNTFNVRKDSDIDRIAEAIVGKIRLQQGLRGI